MLHKKLPTHIRAEQLCRNAKPEGDTLSGIIYVRELGNFSEFAEQGDTPITLSLTFSMDDEGFCCIRGEMEVVIKLTCQRCLQPLQQAIKATILVSPVVSYAVAEHLPVHYEPLLMHNGEIMLTEWIAEELHLALPFVPLHETQCVSYINNKNNDNTSNEEVKQARSPFEGLRSIKKKSESDN